MRLAPIVVALTFLTLVLGSAAKSIPATAIAWHGERVRFQHYTATERAHAPAQNAVGMDPRVFDAWRDELRPGDTFALQVGIGHESLRQNVEMYARFALLPHVQVDARSADVVLSLLANPRNLGLRYASVREIVDGLWASRVDRGV